MGEDDEVARLYGRFAQFPGPVPDRILHSQAVVAASGAMVDQACTGGQI